MTTPDQRGRVRPHQPGRADALPPATPRTRPRDGTSGSAQTSAPAASPDPPDPGLPERTQASEQERAAQRRQWAAAAAKLAADARRRRFQRAAQRTGPGMIRRTPGGDAA